MASGCQSSCVVNDVLARIQPVRATYVNLYKWPESDAEFVRSVSFDGRHGGSFRQHPAVVDSVSCRQLYLRSYTFSRKESVPEKTKKCLDRVRERVSTAYRRERKMAYYGGGGGKEKKKKYAGFGRAKEASCAAVSAVFRRLLSCTTKVDVVG